MDVTWYKTCRSYHDGLFLKEKKKLTNKSSLSIKFFSGGPCKFIEKLQRLDFSHNTTLLYHSISFLPSFLPSLLPPSLPHHSLLPSPLPPSLHLSLQINKPTSLSSTSSFFCRISTNVGRRYSECSLRGNWPPLNLRRTGLGDLDAV